MSQVIYITGGTKGIGLGMAKKLVEAGYQVAISGRDAEKAKEAAASVGQSTKIIGLQSDVRFLEDEIKAVETIKAHFGRLDVLIANAGLGVFGNIRTMDPQDWQSMIDTNLTGVFNTLKAGVEDLIANKGYYITIASLAGINFFKGGSGYNASKFGVVGFTQAAMLDLREHGVKVSTILPGSVTSYFNDHQPDEKTDQWKIQPEDIGQLVVDLLKMPANALPSKIEIRPTQTADMIS